MKAYMIKYRRIIGKALFSFVLSQLEVWAK